MVRQQTLILESIVVHLLKIVLTSCIGWIGQLRSYLVLGVLKIRVLKQTYPWCIISLALGGARWSKVTGAALKSSTIHFNTSCGQSKIYCIDANIISYKALSRKSLYVPRTPNPLSHPFVLTNMPNMYRAKITNNDHTVFVTLKFLVQSTLSDWSTSCPFDTIHTLLKLSGW